MQPDGISAGFGGMDAAPVGRSVDTRYVQARGGPLPRGWRGWLLLRVGGEGTYSGGAFVGPKFEIRKSGKQGVAEVITLQSTALWRIGGASL